MQDCESGQLDRAIELHTCFWDTKRGRNRDDTMAPRCYHQYAYCYLSPSSLAWLLLPITVSLVQSYEVLRGARVQEVVTNSHQASHEGRTTISSNMKMTTTMTTDVDVGEFLSSARRRSLLCFGAYAGDLNTLEYAQQLRYYIPILQSECNIDTFGFLLNASPIAARLFCEAVDLPRKDRGRRQQNRHQNQQHVHLFVDPTGHAGRLFGVNRGWFADQSMLHPYAKLFCMMPWASLSSVVDGYVGHPTRAKPWIQDALAVGQYKGRWPDFALELANENDNNPRYSIRHDNFKHLPWVGTRWARRPLELATLRLQNLMGFTVRHWKHVMPDETALQHGILTQQAACLVYDTMTQRPCYVWRDEGNCHVADFQDMIAQLQV